MKYLFALVLLAGCAQTPANSPGTIDYLVAGQSNAVSLVRIAYDSPYTSNTEVSHYDPDTNVGDFTAEFEHTSAASYVWQHLGDLMPYHCRFTNVAVGGTSIVAWGASLHTRIDSALAMHPYAAILWIQGETDMINGLDEETYYESLKKVVADSRAASPGIQWYIAYGMGGGANNPIRLAQLRLINEGVVLAGPDLDTIRSPENMDDIQLHFVGPGIPALAQLWKDALNRRGQ